MDVISKETSNEEYGSLDLHIPMNLMQGNESACTVLVQIDPENASMLEFHGVSGAMGRFEADNDGITLDLKGYQYSGSIHPGPTALIVALNKSSGGIAKVEAITDEFVTLHKTQDVMAKMNAEVVSGEMDNGYIYQEENVNLRAVVDNKKDDTPNNTALNEENISDDKGAVVEDGNDDGKKRKPTPSSANKKRRR